MEAPEQAHRRSHAHVHLAEVHEDHHQHDGVRRQVLELKVVVLQKREKEGGERKHEPGQGIRCEVDKFVGLHADERSNPTLHFPIEPR
jgi:hypothetical protein